MGVFAIEFHRGLIITRARLLVTMFANHLHFGGVVDGLKVVLKVIAFKMVVSSRQRRFAAGGNGTGPPMVQLPSGEELALDPNDAGLSVELASTQTHEPLATELMLADTMPGQTILDAGSNIGYYACRLASRIGPTGRLVSVEPSPETAEILRGNLKRNVDCPVTLHEAVITDRAGAVDFYVATERNVSSLKPRVGAQQVRVDALSIDELSSQLGALDLIRMDIEGHEVQALRGAKSTLARYRPRVVAEVHLPQFSEADRRELKEIFQSNDYACDWFIFRWDDVQLFGSTWFSSPEAARRSATIAELLSIEGETVVASFSPRPA